MDMIYKNRQSKFRGIALILVVVLLILLGNKKLLLNIKEELEERNKIKHQKNIDWLREHNFDTHELVYDNNTNQLRNSSVYFQSVKIDKFDFNVNTKKIENGNTVEKASESN
ncbi:hypothetical protein [Chryseobacterium sp. OSA05B]|uniref:hypothetical protein n=1 Tax=Chryseobacterium sp. OSA05B TaxID=2862650 RepID=UPI001CBE56FE|nr:hypothetical protein [Chryseobacterium sp. OSA05B]